MTPKPQAAKRRIPEKKPASKDQKKLHIAILKQIVTLSTSGFGVVAALAWNNVIQELVNSYIRPYIPNIGFVSLLIYAVLVTVLAVTITVNLSKLISLLEQRGHES